MRQATSQKGLRAGKAELGVLSFWRSRAGLKQAPELPYLDSGGRPKRSASVVRSS